MQHMMVNQHVQSINNFKLYFYSTLIADINISVFKMSLQKGQITTYAVIIQSELESSDIPGKSKRNDRMLLNQRYKKVSCDCLLIIFSSLTSGSLSVLRQSLDNFLLNFFFKLPAREKLPLVALFSCDFNATLSFGRGSGAVTMTGIPGRLVERWILVSCGF